MSVREAMKSPVGRGDGSEGLGAFQDAWTVWQIGQIVGW